MPDVTSSHTAFVKNWLDSLLKPGCPDEYESKTFLAGFGIRIPESIRLMPGEMPENLPFSPPYAVKVCSPDILHKTEEKGVLLNVSESDLSTAVSGLGERFPDCPILVEELASFSGPEFIVGAITDPDYGIAVMAGAGGIMTELYRDCGFRLAPCTVEEAEDLLSELTISPVLEGFRGLDLDKRALAQTLSVVGEAAMALEEHFNQLDINPVVFSQSGWLALDAQIILTSTDPMTRNENGEGRE